MKIHELIQIKKFFFSCKFCILRVCGDVSFSEKQSTGMYIAVHHCLSSLACINIACIDCPMVLFYFQLVACPGKFPTSVCVTAVTHNFQSL